MKKVLLVLLLLQISSCSQQKSKDRFDGEVISATPQSDIFTAKYNGRGSLSVGDKVSIMQYVDNINDLKSRESRNLPSIPHQKHKKRIGEATVLSVMKDRVYELKADREQSIPSDAFIQKL